MAIMALHEDGPLSDYVYFPIVEINAETLQALGASFTWSPVGDNDDRIFRFNFSNDALYTAIGTNMPRQRSADGCIMKNRNVWENVQGVFQRTDTIMTDIEVGTKPDDFDSNIHYMTLTTQTIDNQAYNIYNIKNRGGWSATAHYYLDESTPENRHARLFYADGGLSFGVFNALQYSTSISARYRKFTGFAAAFPASSVGSNVVYPLYWGYDGSTFNPNSSTGGGATNATQWTPYNYIDGSAYVDEQQNYVTFFAHIRLNNIDYYGAAVATMSADSVDAYPRQITCCMWAAEYWGTSIIAGGEIPAGQWGPESGQAGGTGGTWDYTSDIVPLQSVDDLPTTISVGSVIKCYGIDSANMNALAERLYNSESNIWTAWSNKLYNPSAAIIALHYLPTIFSGDYDAENLSRVSFAGQTMDRTADYDPVNGYLQYNQWRNSPLFSLSVPALADSFLDYAPFTRMSLHVPFCGVLPIDPSAVTGGTITVYFRCDAISGAVSARVECVDKFGNSTISYMIGNCAYQIPIAGRTGGAAGLSALAGLGSAAAGVGLIMSGNFAGGGAAILGGSISALANTARDEATQAAVSNVSGNVAPILDLCLWFEISRSVPSTPADKQALQGVPANTTVQLLQLSGTGYAEISEIHLENIPANRGELEEIETLLKNGVIF